MCLSELCDEDAPLSYSNLIELSDLVPAERPQFIAIWNQVTSERRAQVIGRLVDLAEENAQLDFTEVLKIALADDDYLVQEKAIAGIWEGEDRTVIPLLLDILQSDGPAEVRGSAAWGTGEVCPPSPRGQDLAQGRSYGTGVADAVPARRGRPLGGASSRLGGRLALQHAPGA